MCENVCIGRGSQRRRGWAEVGDGSGMDGVSRDRLRVGVGWVGWVGWWDRGDCSLLKANDSIISINGSVMCHCANCVSWLCVCLCRMRVKKLPMILALHLKRFKYMEQLHRYTKLSYRVVFPLELRLFNTSGDAVNLDRMYDLVAVVVHCGRYSSTHSFDYRSKIKDWENICGSWVLCKQLLLIVSVCLSNNHRIMTHFAWSDGSFVFVYFLFFAVTKLHSV